MVAPAQSEKLSRNLLFRIMVLFAPRARSGACDLDGATGHCGVYRITLRFHHPISTVNLCWGWDSRGDVDRDGDADAHCRSVYIIERRGDIRGVVLVYTLSLCMRFHYSGMRLVSKGGLIRGGIRMECVDRG